jgi:hypothetical protein
MGSAMAIKLCVTLRHGSTKPLPKNRRDGNEAIQSTPGSVKRSDKQRRGVRTLHGALIKPRLNGTRALPRSVRRTMMPRERTMLLRADRAARRRPATWQTSSQRRRSRSLKSTRTPSLALRAREGHHHMHTMFAIESDDSPAPGIIPESVRVHDEPGATTLPRGVRRAARLRFCGPATRNPATRERSRSGVE